MAEKGDTMVHDREETVSKISDALTGIVEIDAVYTSRFEIIVKGRCLIDISSVVDQIEWRLRDFSDNITMERYRSSVVIRISGQSKETRKIPYLNIALLALTVATTLAAGALWNSEWAEHPSLILQHPISFIYAGVPFSLSLLIILLFHEFGHYLAARANGVNVSLPYFVPAPPVISPFGTFGALIMSKSAFLNRKQLLDVGAAGPLAGFIVSIVVLIVGIGQSSVLPIPTDSQSIYFGEPLLMKFITLIIKGPISGDNALFLSSVAFAGWVGVLVTMLNLLPLGQLDGGRIIYALFGRAQKIISKFVILGLVVLSFFWLGWLLWLFIGFLLKTTHPPTMLDEVPLGRGRALIGVICIAAFILCFIPVPIWFQ